MHTLRIGVVADYSPAVTAHRAIPVALKLAAAEMGCAIDLQWLPTTDVSRKSDCHGIWCAPGSPYASTEGALDAIGFARTNNVPFLGTCGGFQHALIEYARNHLNAPQADHQESNPS